MEGYDNEEIEVTAGVTDLYAAPELARKGNETKVMVIAKLKRYLA